MTKRLKFLILALPFLFATSKNALAVQTEMKKETLNDFLQKRLGTKFQKKNIKEIYMSGPQKTYNACRISS